MIRNDPAVVEYLEANWQGEPVPVYTPFLALFDDAVQLTGHACTPDMVAWVEFIAKPAQ